MEDDAARSGAKPSKLDTGSGEAPAQQATDRESAPKIRPAEECELHRPYPNRRRSKPLMVSSPPHAAWNLVHTGAPA
jgi:hypothetical protein